MLIWLLVIAIVIGGIIGFVNSNKDEEGGGCLGGMFAGGTGCLLILLRIFLFGLSVAALIWLFRVLFL